MNFAVDADLSASQVNKLKGSQAGAGVLDLSFIIAQLNQPIRDRNKVLTAVRETTAKQLKHNNTCYSYLSGTGGEKSNYMSVFQDIVKNLLSVVIIGS